MIIKQILTWGSAQYSTSETFFNQIAIPKPNSVPPNPNPKPTFMFTKFGWGGLSFLLSCISPISLTG